MVGTLVGRCSCAKSWCDVYLLSYMFLLYLYNVSPLFCLIIFNAISLGCRVRASLMLFCSYKHCKYLFVSNHVHVVDT